MFLDKIKELNKGWYFDYQTLIGMFEFQIIKESHDDDYQGDSRYLFRNTETGEYGFLNFGWGSCSGCDALQSAAEQGNEEINELAVELYESVKWFKDAGEAYHYFVNHDWKGDYGYNKDFVRECTEYLEIETADRILLEDGDE